MKVLSLVREMEQEFLDQMLRSVLRFQYLLGDITYYLLDQKHRTHSLNGMIFRLKLIMNWLITSEICFIEF